MPASKVRALVTGAAGFIGSHLCEALLRRGIQVYAVDSLTSYYDPGIKERNLRSLTSKSGFEFKRADIIDLTRGEVPPDISQIFHLAGQPGVRASWGNTFHDYVVRNISATQHLLEIATALPLESFFYSSSSSVYGNSNKIEFSEEDALHPFSPYGVTKLAGEHLVNAYHYNFGVPVVSARYFTVFGPRQRPDMAFHQMIRAAVDRSEFTVYGDGEQTRDFTFVDDIVEGSIACAEKGMRGGVYNLGGNNLASVNSVVCSIEKIMNRELHVRRIQIAKGDVRSTRASIRKAGSDFGYRPSVSLEDGLRAQVEFILGQ
jgi:nucleoside-diphosphate-sugar epimerase